MAENLDGFKLKRWSLKCMQRDHDPLPYPTPTADDLAHNNNSSLASTNMEMLINSLSRQLQHNVVQLIDIECWFNWTTTTPKTKMLMKTVHKQREFYNNFTASPLFKRNICTLTKYMKYVKLPFALFFTINGHVQCVCVRRVGWGRVAFICHLSSRLGCTRGYQQKRKHQCHSALSPPEGGPVSYKDTNS